MVEYSAPEDAPLLKALVRKRLPSDPRPIPPVPGVPLEGREDLEGNCLRAAIAVITGTPMSDVPEFHREPGHSDYADAWRFGVSKWLSRKNLSLVKVDLGEFLHKNRPLQNSLPQGMCMVVGKWKADSAERHAVVYLASRPLADNTYRGDPLPRYKVPVLAIVQEAYVVAPMVIDGVLPRTSLTLLAGTYPPEMYRARIR